MPSNERRNTSNIDRENSNDLKEFLQENDRQDSP
jgi:hypothetical protein